MPIQSNTCGAVGTITETDPIFIASQAYNITSTHIETLNNTSGTNTGDEDLSSLATKTELQIVKNLAIAMAVAL